MNAIGVDQPWATLFLLTNPTEKEYETRGYHTHIRGTLIIHANKSRNAYVRAALGDKYIQERLAAHGLNVTDLAFGALIGTVNLIDCQRMDRMTMPEVDERELRLGNWTPERFVWKRAPETRIFSRPIPFTGRQGFFNVPYGAVAKELLGEAYEAPSPSECGGLFR